MSRFNLSNGEIAIEVESKGAELKSLRCGEREYMWCADAQFWGRTAPVLFPIVGSLKDKQFHVGDKSYNMGQHGFARDTEFTLAQQTNDSMTFVMQSTQETKEKFPFDFVLEITYSLVGRSVTTTWKVTNTNEDVLSFSIGGHPAFNCATEGYSYHLYKDRDGLERVESFNCNKLSKDGLIVDKPIQIQTPNGVLPITQELFADDALIIKESGIQRVAIADETGTEYLAVDFDAKLLGLWSPAKKNAPFVCIEPWYGVADAEDFSGEWKDRAYANELAPKESFTESYTVTIE